MKVSIIAICLCIFYFTASSASPSPQRNDVTTESAFASTGGPIGSGGLSTTESPIVSSRPPSGGGQNGSGGAGKYVISAGAGWLDSFGKISTLVEVRGESINACQIACNNYNNCVAFTFVSTEQRCDLKNSQQAITLGVFPDTIISGNRQSGYGTYYG